MAMLLQDLSKDKLDSIDRLLAGGGSVGIETLIDHRAVNTIALVAIEREGSRLVLATVKASEPGIAT